VIKLNNVVNALVSNAEFVGDATHIIDWHDSRPQPTEEQIQAKIAELTAAEPMRLLRVERDRRIALTDWCVLPDRTPTQAQLDYRQALRDLPTNSSPELDENGNLINVNWPEKPQ
jgi:hypothetical protein